MSSPSWEEIDRAVAAVLELPEQERAAYLADQPVAVRDEVESLLSAYRRSGDFLGDETGRQTAGPDLPGRMEAILARVKGAVVDADSAPSAAHSSMAVNAGTQLGPYRIEGVLGEGGMGVVYRAVDTKLNRPVAIKFLAGDLGHTFT